MIKQKNVFVLGAGARVPYGFPDGRTLIRLILDAVPEPDKITPFSQCFYHHPAYKSAITAVSMDEFRRALMFSGHTSIDSFLAIKAKVQGFEAIGYAWNRKDRKDNDWMSVLFERMLHGCLDSPADLVSRNKIAFVDFNYDRLLEDFLCTRIEHTYGISRAAAWDVAQKFKTVHVYGSLGEFDANDNWVARLDRWNMSQGAQQPTPDDMYASATAIRLMYDKRQHDSIDAAKKLLADAERVIFLGFGFDPDNIARLELPRLLVGKNVYATRYGVPEGDWQSIIANLAPAGLTAGHRDHDSVKFLLESAAIVG